MTTSPSRRDLTRALSTNRTFVGLTEDDFAPFFEQAEIVHLDKSACFIHAGDRLSASYILITGCVEVTEEPIPHKKMSRQHFSSGTILAGGALIKSWPQTKAHTTTEETVLLKVSRDAFKALLNSGNNVAFRFLDELLAVFVEEVRSANHHLDYLYSHPDETLSMLRRLQNTSSGSEPS